MNQSFKRGDMVTLSTPVGPEDTRIATDRKGSIAVFLETSYPQGYARIQFYGDSKDRTYLVHPESLRMHHSSNH